jgi:hypothetical protein
MGIQRPWYLLGEVLGIIMEESYRVHIVPAIKSYIELMRREVIDLVLIQDGAPSYSTTDIKVDLKERGITVIF